MMEDRFLKCLRKKARSELRGWPIATIAFYGPNLSQATKVAVGITPSENAEVNELRDWKVDRGNIRTDPVIARSAVSSLAAFGRRSPVDAAPLSLAGIRNPAQESTHAVQQAHSIASSAMASICGRHREAERPAVG